MSLKKKIILSFIVSGFIITLLSVFLYLNFIEIKKETAFLELTDTIRSKSLQLRRHEKNYFLYAPAKAEEESKAIYAYLGELDDILKSMNPSSMDRTASLKTLVLEYREQFGKIEKLLGTAMIESGKLKVSSLAYLKISRLIESNFLDKPLEDVNYLQETFSLPSGHNLISCLNEFDADISALRKTGENILASSKELDKTAREKVDSFINMSRIAILVFFPLFLIVGFGTILFIISNVVKRLQMITNLIEKTGKGDFTHTSEPAYKWGKDEVGQLIRKFNDMEELLSHREKELLRSKKLSAIGMLASGVAHELNNPLNNIYTTAQRLTKKSGDQIPLSVKNGLDDIFSQALRVKGIVSDLLEFARGREPHIMAVELRSFISGAYKHLGSTISTGNVRFSQELHPDEIVMYADPEQLEQVFINLFINAIDAMSGEGALTVKAEEEDTLVRIKVSDTGKGISRETLEKIFEPFYTTKNKGTGLGLAIVYNIIQKHRGGIQVESEEGRGTTFIITLPKENA